jgi:hypothetical protein
MSTAARHGLGDPRVPWIVLLDVVTPDAPDLAAAAAALAALADEAGWPAPTRDAVTSGRRRSLLTRLSGDSPDVLRIGLHDDGVLLAARHDRLDGLALLAAASHVTEHRMRSSARGVEAGQREGGLGRALAGRAWELLARPPARVPPATAAPRPGDAFADLTVDGVPRTADLVHAGAGAVAAWSRSRGVPARRISVAVGVSSAGRAPDELADRSGFLRLRDVERLSLDEVRQRLREEPLQPGGGGSGEHRLLARVSGVALRLAAPRLGSTLLVSHLGSVEASGSVEALAFYPVTGGGSGLSLGAATVEGRTTLTLRGRGARYDDEGLAALLALVADRLG